MISAERKAELEAAGYSIEDMGAEWGADFGGQHRWLNSRLTGDTFGVIQYSEADAWADADQFEVKYRAVMTHKEVVAELDALLGAPDGSAVELTTGQVLRVRTLQQKLSTFFIEV